MNNLLKWSLQFVLSLSFISVKHIQLAKEKWQGIMSLDEVPAWQQAGEGEPHGDQQVSRGQVQQVVVGGGSENSISIIIIIL